MAPLERDEVKAAFKEALKEWLEEKFSEFGKWSFRAICAALFAALTYFVLSMSGWHKP